MIMRHVIWISRFELVIYQIACCAEEIKGFNVYIGLLTWVSNILGIQ